MRRGAHGSVAIALLVVVLASPALAEAPPSPLRETPEGSLSPFRLDPTDLARTERRARWRRNVGIGLSIPGVTLMVLGGVLVGMGVKDTRLVAGAAEIAAGSVSAGVGLLFTVPGVLLWIGGQDDIDLVRWRARRMKAGEQMATP